MNIQRVFEIEYANDRRKHRHRCRACSRIVTAGERVLMLRQRRGSWVVHVDPCAESQHSPSYTWREVFHIWAGEKVPA